jgi:hypothetical protein
MPPGVRQSFTARRIALHIYLSHVVKRSVAAATKSIFLRVASTGPPGREVL